MATNFQPTTAQLTEGKRLAARYFRQVVTQFTDAELLSGIKFHSAVQKTNPPTSNAWEAASRWLKLLFAEMARRYPNGSGPYVMP